MRKGVRYRVLERALLAQRCTPRTGKGDHVVWYCPAADISRLLFELASCHQA